MNKNSIINVFSNHHSDNDFLNHNLQNDIAKPIDYDQNRNYTYESKYYKYSSSNSTSDKDYINDSKNHQIDYDFNRNYKYLYNITDSKNHQSDIFYQKYCKYSSKNSTCDKDYKSLYNKYKMKYLNLKNNKINQVGAGKTILVFDFDDTLMMTPALNYIRDKNNKIMCSISATEYYQIESKIRKKVNDYTEFGEDIEKTVKLINKGCIIKSTHRIINNLDKNSIIGIVTARSIDPKILAKIINSKLNQKIKDNNVISVNNDNEFNKKINDLKSLKKENIAKIFLEKLSLKKNISVSELLNTKKSEFRKALSIIWFISKGYSSIYFYDDFIGNIKIVDDIKEISKNFNLSIKIFTKQIKDKDKKLCNLKIKKELKKNKIYNDTNLNTIKCNKHLELIDTFFH